MLRASMRHAGAIRLDHVLGLKRLYLVPHGFGPENGAYVQMPFEALLAVTAQESVGASLHRDRRGPRHRAGGLSRSSMADWGIWSYLVMMFERDDHGAFRGVDQYSANALVTFNTHDLSTYAGWRSFSDLKLKRSLGIDPGESDDARWHALAMLDNVLRHHGIDRHDLYSVPVSWREPSPAAGDLAGGSFGPGRPAQYSRHRRRASELAAAASGVARAYRFRDRRRRAQERDARTVVAGEVDAGSGEPPCPAGSKIMG